MQGDGRDIWDTLGTGGNEVIWIARGMRAPGAPGKIGTIN